MSDERLLAIKRDFQSQNIADRLAASAENYPLSILCKVVYATMGFIQPRG
jgi:hypothetical protein